MPNDLMTILSPVNIILFVVVFTRLSGLIISAPLLSTYPIPIQVKTWFMASIALIIFPLVSAKAGFPLPTSIPELTIILLKEFMIGYVIGFVSNIIFIGAEIAADLVSIQTGLTAGQVLNPMTGDTSPVLAQAYTMIATMVFISLNGYKWIFAAIYKSFEIMPPGYGFLVGKTFTHNFTYITSEMFVIGLKLALPIFSVLLLSDVLLGFVSKMMPKMSVYTVALPLKIYIGLLLFIMLVPQLWSEFNILIEQYLSNLIQVFGG